MWTAHCSSCRRYSLHLVEVYVCCQRIALAAVETDRLDSRMRGLRQTCAVYSAWQFTTQTSIVSRPYSALNVRGVCVAKYWPARVRTMTEWRLARLSDVFGSPKTPALLGRNENFTLSRVIPSYFKIFPCKIRSSYGSKLVCVPLNCWDISIPAIIKYYDIGV